MSLPKAQPAWLVCVESSYNPGDPFQATAHVIRADDAREAAHCAARETKTADLRDAPLIWVFALVEPARFKGEAGVIVTSLEEPHE